MIRLFRFCVFIWLSVLLQSAVFSHGQSFKTPDGLIYSNFTNQPASSQDLLFDLVRQIRWDTPKASRVNPQGLRLRFEKIEGQDARQTGTARYRVFAEGAPENKVYKLSVWQVGQKLTAEPQDLFVNGQGLVMTHQPNAGQENIFKAPGDELNLIPQIKAAEPIRYLLSSNDMQLSILGTLVPHPLIAQDQACTLELRIAEPGATAVLIVTDGFPAQTKMPLVLESEGQSAHMTVAVDSSGHAEVADLPTVPGKAQGTLKVTAEGSSCLPSAVLPWNTGPQPDQKAR